MAAPAAVRWSGAAAASPATPCFRCGRSRSGSAAPFMASCAAKPKNKTRPYIVMEYFPGHSLHHYVVQSGPFSLAEFLSVAMQIAKGMFAVHQQHIIHRDLKPEN